MIQYKNCLLVGAGQLGSRYLQGLSKIDRQLKITVVDPSSASLDLARQRLSEVSSATCHEVQFTTSLVEAPKQLDLALVVTPAHCRADVVQMLCAKHDVNAWILEKVLAQSNHQLYQLQNMLANSTRAWVNTPMRLMSWHKNIRSQMLFNQPCTIQVQVVGGSWGMACNAIHYIDLVKWWTQSFVESVADLSLHKWEKSKRPGFYEVFGSLSVCFANGSLLELSCDQSTDPLRISIDTPSGRWTIHELEGLAFGPTGQSLEGSLAFQSDLTSPLVSKILDKGECDLPTLQESLSQHLPLISTLLKHWNHYHECSSDILPIT